jgi:hypothetical protein
MRKLISFFVAVALFVGGIYLALEFGTGGSNDPTTPHKFRGMVWGACILLISLGGYWLWADFIGPAFGRHVED